MRETTASSSVIRALSVCAMGALVTVVVAIHASTATSLAPASLTSHCHHHPCNAPPSYVYHWCLKAVVDTVHRCHYVSDRSLSFFFDDLKSPAKQQASTRYGGSESVAVPCFDQSHPLCSLDPLVELDRRAMSRLKLVKKRDGKHRFYAYRCWDSCRGCSRQIVLHLLRQEDLPKVVLHPDYNLVPSCASRLRCHFYFAKNRLVKALRFYVFLNGHLVFRRRYENGKSRRGGGAGGTVGPRFERVHSCGSTVLGKMYLCQATYWLPRRDLYVEVSRSHWFFGLFEPAVHSPVRNATRLSLLPPLPRLPVRDTEMATMCDPTYREDYDYSHEVKVRLREQRRRRLRERAFLAVYRCLERPEMPLTVLVVVRETLAVFAATAPDNWKTLVFLNGTTASTTKKGDSELSIGAYARIDVHHPLCLLRRGHRLGRPAADDGIDVLDRAARFPDLGVGDAASSRRATVRSLLSEIGVRAPPVHSPPTPATSFSSMSSSSAIVDGSADALDVDGLRGTNGSRRARGDKRRGDDDGRVEVATGAAAYSCWNWNGTAGGAGCEKTFLGVHWVSRSDLPTVAVTLKGTNDSAAASSDDDDGSGGTVALYGPFALSCRFSLPFLDCDDDDPFSGPSTFSPSRSACGSSPSLSVPAVVATRGSTVVPRTLATSPSPTTSTPASSSDAETSSSSSSIFPSLSPTPSRSSSTHPSRSTPSTWKVSRVQVGKVVDDREEIFSDATLEDLRRSSPARRDGSWEIAVKVARVAIPADAGRYFCRLQMESPPVDLNAVRAASTDERDDDVDDRLRDADAADATSSETSSSAGPSRPSTPSSPPRNLTVGILRSEVTAEYRLRVLLPTLEDEIDVGRRLGARSDGQTGADRTRRGIAGSVSPSSTPPPPASTPSSSSMPQSSPLSRRNEKRPESTRIDGPSSASPASSSSSPFLETSLPSTRFRHRWLDVNEKTALANGASSPSVALPAAWREAWKAFLATSGQKRRVEWTSEKKDGKRNKRKRLREEDVEKSATVLVGRKDSREFRRNGKRFARSLLRRDHGFDGTGESDAESDSTSRDDYVDLPKKGRDEGEEQIENRGRGRRRPRRRREEGGGGGQTGHNGSRAFVLPHAITVLAAVAVASRMASCESS